MSASVYNSTMKRTSWFQMTVLKPVGIVLAVLLVVGTFIWQAVTSHGNPDPTAPNLSHFSMVMSAGVLVFREGLEAILVLATVTAGMARSQNKDYLKAVPAGAMVAFVATIATWFIVVALISSVSASELKIQAATGLLAIVVLLVVMNWFFHKLYWTGWISGLNERRKDLMESDATSKTFFGLAMLGFAAIYREGFEIVLFLQNLRLRAGNEVILEGAAIGLGLTLLVAAVSFAGHKKLPFKKMLIITGILLGVVLLIMVGEQAQEMQLAGWLPSHPLNINIPDWAGLWFSVFPNTETLVAQLIAGTLVVGSYLWASYGPKIMKARAN